MEMKYNSLKEALPSLLEEKARLEEEKNRLETIKSELEEQHSEIIKELEEERFDKRVAIGKGTVFSSAKNVLVDEEFCTIVRDIKNIIDKETVLLKAVSFLEFQTKNLQSEMTEFACKLDEVNLLIKSIENISLIANMNFKKTFPNHQHLFDATFNDMLDTISINQNIKACYKASYFI